MSLTKRILTTNNEPIKKKQIKNSHNQIATQNSETAQPKGKFDTIKSSLTAFGDEIKNFVPFACFYDENTILTKNGELLQIIRFANFTHDESLEETFDLRSTIRTALLDNLKNRDISFWIHTVRREKEIEWSKLKQKDTFEYILHNNWRKDNKFDGAFVNEVYLTILIRGVNYPLFNVKTMFSFFQKSFLEHSFYGFLRKQHKILTEFVDAVLYQTRKFIPKRLGFYKKNDEYYYSEQLEFFDKIFNFINVPSLVPITDLSQFVNISRYRIGFNNISVQNPVKKSIIAVFSIKDYQEISVNLVSKLTSLNLEIVIYQTFDSVNSPLAKLHYQNAAQVFKVSQDAMFYEKSGIKQIADKNWDRSHFGENQISVILYAANEIELNNRVELFIKELSDVGFCIVREDLFNEDVFYGLIPANYDFLKRKKYCHLSKFAAFAITANYPSGNAFPAKWKYPITVFSTIRKTPYFFNFHHSEQSNGHTLIIGPKNSGASVLSNFLISESLKLKPKIISISVDSGSDVFFKNIGGTSKSFSTNNSTSGGFAINPFSLFHSRHERVAKMMDDNIAFIRKFFHELMEYNERPLSKAELTDLDLAMKQMVKNSFKVFTVSDFITMFNERSNIRRLKRFIPGGEYAFMFSKNDDIEDFDKIISINLFELIGDLKLFSIVFDYIFYRIDSELDGTPMIIKLDDVMELFSTEKFKPAVLQSWLSKLAKYNAVCLINLDTANVDYLKQYISDGFFNAMDSLFFMPEKSVLKGNVVTSVDDYNREKEIKKFYKENLRLTDKDIKTIFSLSAMSERHVMLKHNGIDCILRFDLSNLPHILFSLSSPIEIQQICNSIRQSNPNDSFNDTFRKFCLELGLNVDDEMLIVD